MLNIHVLSEFCPNSVLLQYIYRIKVWCGFVKTGVVNIRVLFILYIYRSLSSPGCWRDEPVNAQHYNKGKNVADQFKCPLISGCNSSGFDGVKAVMVHRLGTQDAAPFWVEGQTSNQTETDEIANSD